MTRWFRYYDDAVNDPKVQKLSGDDFKAWVNMLCLASKNDGVLPSISDMAFALRMAEEKVSALLDGFTRIELVDCVEGQFRPHNWHKRQYKSDVSTERVKRFRNVSSSVSETSPETEQIRSESEQTRARGNVSSSVSASLRSRILKAFEAANSPNIPDTSRADRWLAQGYDAELVIAVIAELVKKKPSISALNYFDNAIAEAHQKRNPAPAKLESQAEKETRWRSVLDRLAADRPWPFRYPSEIPAEFAENHMRQKAQTEAA